jgi:hypothetical protein
VSWSGLGAQVAGGHWGNQIGLVRLAWAEVGVAEVVMIGLARAQFPSRYKWSPWERMRTRSMCPRSRALCERAGAPLRPRDHDWQMNVRSTAKSPTETPATPPGQVW